MLARAENILASHLGKSMVEPIGHLELSWRYRSTTLVTTIYAKIGAKAEDLTTSRVFPDNTLLFCGLSLRERVKWHLILCRWIV